MSTATHRLAPRAMLALFLACAKSQVPPAPEVEVKLPIAGLWTNPNDFDAPPGSCEVLDNMTQDRPGIWEPFRGFGLLEPVPTITGPINEGTTFRGQIIVHHATSSISRWTGTAWSTYSGTFTPPASAASGRVRFYESAQSLFVTTSAGVMELDSPTGTWRLTGCPKALDGTATLRRTVNETGFATAGGQWAYREEWGFKNANARLQIGPPSGRVLVQSPAAVVAGTGAVAKVNTSSTVTVTNLLHGFATGEYVDVTLGGVETWFAAGTFQVTRISDTSFTYSDAVTNSSGSTQNPGASITYGFTAGRGVTRVVPIPAGITTDNFVQSYRSGKSAGATSEPNDQLAQVYERSPTNLEIAAGSMTFVDIVPDDFRGALLDTSAETVLGAKYRPPVCADMAEFHNVTWCAATKSLQTLELQLIAAGGAAGFQVGDNLTFADHPEDLNNRTYVFSMAADSTETVSTGHFKVFTDGSAAQNIANTARSVVHVLNGWSSNTTLYAEYISGDQEAPGKIRVYGRTPLATQFTVFCNAPSSLISGSAVIPTLGTTRSISDIARTGSTVTVNTIGTHGYANGQIVELFLSTNTSHFPNGNKTVTVTSSTAFTYTEAGATVVAEANGGLFVSEPFEDVQSEVLDRADRLAFSLPEQPWSVPLPNEYFVEGKPTTTSAGPTIFRIIPNRDSLLVWADTGLSQITGYYPNFALTKLQSPLKMLASGAAATQGTPGVSYALTDTGVVGVITSPAPVSTPIQDIFQNLQANAPAALKNYAFAVAYPSDFKVYFFVPSSNSDTNATNAYVLHTRTGDWSRRAVTATSGWVDAVSDKLYLGQASGAIWVERKTRGLSDYYDPTGTTFAYSAVSGLILTVASTTGLSVGDLVTNAASKTETSVTALDSTHITLASVTGWAATGTAVQSGVAISAAIRPTRWFGKEGAGVDKEVDSGMLLVQPPSTTAEFTTLGLSFRNDYNPTFSTPEALTLDSVVTSQIPFRVPDHMQRSGWLQWNLTHAVGGERFRLLGFSINHRASGVKSGF